MSRFFVDKENISDSEIVIVGEDVKHISKVLRLRTGEKISVCDKSRTDYLCEVLEISPDKVSARIIEKSENTAEPPVFLTLYQGLPKSDKMDYIIQKCVELGVSEIVPVITKRVVSIPRDGDKKITRWQRIAEEAAKQCGRGIVPRVSPVVDFDRAILEMTSSTAVNIMPYECEKEGKLRDVIGEIGAKNINIIIGPEGGFDDSEVSCARKNGVITVTLGPRILRTETAPLAIASAIMFARGDW